MSDEQDERHRDGGEGEDDAGGEDGIPSVEVTASITSPRSRPWVSSWLGGWWVMAVIQ
jgi:hypothetical protein